MNRALFLGRQEAARPVVLLCACFSAILASASGPPPIVLSEVLAWPDRGSDWVELRNLTDEPASLDGCHLSDDPELLHKYAFAPGQFVPAHGFLVIECDGDLASSVDNTGFGLSRAGDDVYLAHSNFILDAVTFGLQARGLSISRLPPTSMSWRLTAPTPDEENTVVPLAPVNALRVNEWMASADRDWFELFNQATQPVDLSSLWFLDDFGEPPETLPPLSYIGARGFARIWAVGSDANDPDEVGFKLSADGEMIALLHTSGQLFERVDFGPQERDISEGRLPDGGDGRQRFTVPTPGESNFLPFPNLVINEVLLHTDPPFEDAVELHNPTQTSLPIGGFYLSNSPNDLQRYRIPDGTTIPAGGYVVFYQADFDGPNAASPFRLNSAHGDEFYVTEARGDGSLGMRRAAASLPASANSVSFGLITTPEGTHYAPLIRPTFGVDYPATVEEFRAGHGQVNSGPAVGPVVISEIMYHPPEVEGLPAPMTGPPEFIELENLTPYPVNFYDEGAPTNTWALGEAVQFRFPKGFTMPPRSLLLVVPFHPEDPMTADTFRSYYDVPPEIPLLGPYSGKLNGRGETLRLLMPDTPQAPPHPDVGFVPQLLVDLLDYQDRGLWPTNADGWGASLQRLESRSHGNNPANWIAAVPTPGRRNADDPADTDDDGMPDEWEARYGFDIGDPTDALEDADGDGALNVHECGAGTDPWSAGSHLEIGVECIGWDVLLTFDALAGRSYTVQYRKNFEPDQNEKTWLTVTNVPAAAQRVVSFLDRTAIHHGDGYYRLVTPARE